jgi:hypothetical protein
MTATEFGEYLGRFGKELGVRIQDGGPLAGLPCSLEDAMEVVRGMRMLGLAAPRADELRAWYQRGGSVAASANSPAMRVYEALNDLGESDLHALEEEEVLLFAVRLSNWLTITRGVIAHRRMMRT